MKKHLYTSLLLLFGAVTGAFSQSMSISGGNDHSLFICSKGILYACGDNHDGRLGLVAGNTGYIPTFTKVDVVGLSFSQVTAGSGAHNVALACNGLVYCWGENASYQCGQSAGAVVKEPTKVPNGEAPAYDESGNLLPAGSTGYLGGIKFIAATTSASFALLEDGRAVGWGGNSDNGAWIKTPTPNPVFIIDESTNKPLEGITYIAGGDNNCLLLVDPDGDGLGTVYSIGNVNGRVGLDGGQNDGAIKGAKTYTAAPVLKMADETNPQTSEAGEPLTNIRMVAAGDEAGFAVDGITGYVYAWGTNGGGGRCGLGKSDAYLYAARVVSGDYGTISGEEYLTDVVEVIGGNGYGAAITKEGYMLYWGKNNAAEYKIWGGVVPDPDFKGAATNENNATTILDGATIKHKNGPVFAKYGDGSVVKDAVHLARGDLFGFMVNSNNDYYVWGQTASTGSGNPHTGHMATGKVEDYKNYLYPIQTPCEPADPCPTAYMVGPINKCPGEEISLYAGFTPSVGKDDVYEFLWYKDGVLMDKNLYKTETIKIKEAGVYKVGINYTGSNTMCDACETSYASVEVIDMDMPIDVDTTVLNCVAEGFELRPTAVDDIHFSAKLNNRLYNSPKSVKFAAFSTESSADVDTLEVFDLEETNGIIDFHVTGDKIASGEVHQNKDLYGNIIDTTYTVWVEDISSFDTYLYKDMVFTNAGGSFQKYGILLDIYSDADLKSFDIFVKSYSGNTDITVTPVVYNATKNVNSMYVVGSEYRRGSKQTFVISDDAPNKVTVKCDMKLEGNTARGVRYILGMEFDGSCNISTYEVKCKTNSTEFATPVKDSEEFGIFAIGATANHYNDQANGADQSCYSNVCFGKLTDYDCGRIPLSARYGCPPCNQPDGIVKIEVDGTAHASAKDTIYLCEESDAVTLGVSGIKKSAEPAAKFDELWFLDKIGTDATAIQTDEAAAASTLAPAITWSAAKAGTTETYYIKIRDNEKPTSALCYKYDSIYVHYYEKPVAPTIDPIAFCENATDKTMLTTALAGTNFEGLTVNWYDSDAATKTATSEPDLSALTAATTAYTFYYSVTDDATGCESDVTTVEVTVYGVPEDPLATLDPFCKGDATVALATASPVEAYTVTWYGDATGTTTLTSKDLSLLAAGTYDYSYTLTSDAPENCTGDAIPYSFKVQDSTFVSIDTVQSCGTTEISANPVTLKPSDASVTYTLDNQPVTATSFSNPTYLGAVGALVATAEATGYCTNTSAPIQLYVKEEAASVEGALTVKYLKTDAVNGAFKNLIAQTTGNPQVDPVVEEKTGYTFNWYADNTGAAGTKLSECPVPDVPTGDDDVTLYYWVSQTNADGCESTKEKVTVQIFATPTPNTKNLEYCKNSDKVTDLATAGAATVNGDATKFHLEWISPAGVELGANAPTPDVSAAGVTVYKVYQVSTEGAKSSAVDVKVTVYDVMEPTLSPSNQDKYCASSSLSSPLVADINKDEDNQYKASEIIWTQLDADGTYKTTISPVVTLNVTSDTTYRFQAYQTYTISATNEVCQGEAVDATVKVTYVPKVKTTEVLYLKADANASGSFDKNVLQQSADAVTVQRPATPVELQWYESDCTTPITGTPTPKLDPTVPEGEDDLSNTYCVSQVVDGCKSVPEQVQIRISDALPPTPYAYHYCEGETMEDLKAKINPQPGSGKTAADYTLLWYNSKPSGPSSPAVQEDPAKPDYAMSGQIATVVGGVATTTTYFVAQKDNTTGAISTAMPVTITVYPKPIVVTTDPAAVCEESINLENENIRTVNNVTETISYTYGFMGAQNVPSLASVTGEYSVTPSYQLPVGAVDAYTVVLPADLKCVGAAKPVKVDIHDLTVPDMIVGPSTTCPGTTVELTAEATSTNPGTVTYAWGDDAATTIAAGAPANQSTFTSGALSTVPRTVYTYSVTATAGACTKSVPNKKTVEIGNGVVDGSLLLTEEGNDNHMNPQYPQDGEPSILFPSCGEPVKIAIGRLEGDQDFVWYKGDQKVGEGPEFSTPAYATNDVSVYTLKYTNKCEAVVKFTINTVPLSTQAITTEPDVMCEGSRYETKLQYTLDANGQVPSIKWYRTQPGGQPKLVAENNNQASTYNDAAAKTSMFFIDRTIVDDSGEYSYEASFAGCHSNGVTNTLQVKEYIRSNIVIDPNDLDVEMVSVPGSNKKKAVFIIDRHATKTIAINIDIPRYREAENFSWRENDVETHNQNPLVLTDFTQDRLFNKIILTDSEYCPDTLMADLLVDAELQLKTTLSDTLCSGSSDVLVIDTTGTGAFRRPNGNPTLLLNSVSKDRDGADKVTPINLPRADADGLIRVTVDPLSDITYEVTFSYNGKKEESKESVVVIAPISLTVPEIPTICEGTDIPLTVTNVGPEKTTVTWEDMDNGATIIEGKTAETVRVKPLYRESASHQFDYVYNVVAYNSICKRDKTYEVHVKVDEPLKGEITGIKEICQGGKANFDASAYDATTYAWTSSDSTAVLTEEAKQEVSPNVSSSYYLEMTRGLCTSKDTFVVTVHTNPVVLRVDSIALRDKKIILDPAFGQAPFTYAIDAQPADGLDEKYNLTFANHVVYVTDANDCKTTFLFSMSAPEVSIPEYFTPNGNGANDSWVIPNIAEVYPNAVIKIFDRFGKLVAEFLGADTDGWDGTYKGKNLPSTDYWYQVTIDEINREYVGHFTLLRR